MKRVLKSSLSIFLAMTIIFSSAISGLSEVDIDSVFAVKAKAATSGITGDCTWTLDGTVLTISGNGEMENYSSNPNLPWGEKITEVIIKDGVTSIGAFSFLGCTSLESVTIGNNVTIIYEYAFCKCKNLKSITIPDTVTRLGGYVFMDCMNLETVTIGEGVTGISGYAFYRCENLSSIVLTDNIKSIGDNAFWYCDNLKYVFCSNPSFDFESKTIGYSNYSLERAVWHFNATDHTYDDYSFDYSSNTKKHECIVCGVTTESEIIPARGHTSVKDEAIEVTCTTPGKTEGSHCSVCNTVIVAQTSIPATGHSSSEWIIDTESTVSAPGSKHKECTECGEILETETIPQLKPATPKVAATNEINGVNITWNAVDGAVKYNVYRRQAGSNVWTLLGTTTGTAILDTKVTSGVFYCYSVTAYNNAGQSSRYVSGNTKVIKYMAVPKLTGISNAMNGLFIKWNTVPGATNGYRVYRRGAGSTYWTYLATVKTPYYTDTQVKNRSGEYFRYTVIADGGYHSKFDVSGLYLMRLSAPALKSAVSSRAGITVKWGSVKGATYYNVYRKTANSNWVYIGRTYGNTRTSYLDKTAKKGTTYTYTVRAAYGLTTSWFNSGISCYDKY